MDTELEFRLQKEKTFLVLVTSSKRKEDKISEEDPAMN